MKWEVESPKTEVASVTYLGDVRLSVSGPTDDGKTWQHFSLSFGAFDAGTPEECRQTWPREAIAEARRLLELAEAAINEEQQPCDADSGEQ
jgi:hypothetical protein